jgi:uncharacterized protein (DUF3084 family)
MGKITTLVDTTNEAREVLRDSINSNTAALTNATHTFVTLAEQIEQQTKALEVREEEVVKRGQELLEKERFLDEKEVGLNQREVGLNEREERIAQKEKDWSERVELNAAKLASLIQINVGMILYYYYLKQNLT